MMCMNNIILSRKTREGAYLQIELLTDKERSHAFSTFLETILDEVERNEVPDLCGAEKGNSCLFCI